MDQRAFRADSRVCLFWAYASGVVLYSVHASSSDTLRVTSVPSVRVTTLPPLGALPSLVAGALLALLSGVFSNIATRSRNSAIGSLRKRALGLRASGLPSHADAGVSRPSTTSLPTRSLRASRSDAAR